MSEWIDVTRPIRGGMPHWPGDPDVVVERFIRMEDGEACNVTRLELCAHTSTHIDAPFHYLPSGAPMEQFPLELATGTARIIEIADPHAVTEEELRGQAISAGERILLRTRNSDYALEGAFREDFVYISAGAARYLAECGVALVGTDGMSVGGFHHDLVETHQVLLGAGIWAVENLDLSGVAAGRYEMLCLPLLLPGADGAPCRVLLRAFQ